MEARRQDALVGDVGQFAQGTEDGLARREDQRVLDEGAVGILLREREFGGDDAAHEDGLARAHGEREDVAGVVQRQRFAQAFERILTNESVVRPYFFQAGVDTLVGNQTNNIRVGEAHRLASFLRFGKKRFVQIGDFRGAEHQPQIPVGFQRAQLCATQVTQLAAFVVLDCEFQDFADGRVSVARVVFRTPGVDPFRQCLIEVAHGRGTVANRWIVMDSDIVVSDWTEVEG